MLESTALPFNYSTFFASPSICHLYFCCVTDQQLLDEIVLPSLCETMAVISMPSGISVFLNKNRAERERRKDGAEMEGVCWGCCSLNQICVKKTEVTMKLLVSMTKLRGLRHVTKINPWRKICRRWPFSWTWNKVT